MCGTPHEHLPTPEPSCRRGGRRASRVARPAQNIRICVASPTVREADGADQNGGIVRSAEDRVPITRREQDRQVAEFPAECVLVDHPPPGPSVRADIPFGSALRTRPDSERCTCWGRQLPYRGSAQGGTGAVGSSGLSGCLAGQPVPVAIGPNLPSGNPSAPAYQGIHRNILTYTDHVAYTNSANLDLSRSSPMAVPCHSGDR
jgi:hypothetical protein